MNDTTVSVKGENFTRFKAERAIRNSSLKPFTRHLLNVMWQLADAKTGIIPRPVSMAELASHTGMSLRSVNTHVKESRDGGWLLAWAPETRNAIARHEKSKYQLLLPEQMQELHDSSAGAAHQSAGAASEQMQELHTGIIPSFFSRGDGGPEEGSADAAPEPSLFHEKKNHAATPASEMNSPRRGKPWCIPCGYPLGAGHDCPHLSTDPRGHRNWGCHACGKGSVWMGFDDQGQPCYWCKNCDGEIRAAA